MKTEKETFYIPYEAYKFINKMLFNYPQIDKIIDSRINYMREIYIQNMNVTNRSYLESYQKPNNTLENVIIKLDEDWLVKRYKVFKKIINSYINELSNKENKIDYYLIKYKYFDKRSNEYIEEKTNFNNKELKEKYAKLRFEIYKRAIKQGVFEEVYKCQNAK